MLPTDPETERRFFHSYAHALQIWQDIDASLFRIFSRLMKGAGPQLVSVSYFHIQSFNAKRQLVHGCAAYRLKGTKHESDWTRLNKRIDTLSYERNRLVHSFFGVRSPDGNPAHERIELTPYPQDWFAPLKKRAPGDHNYALDQKRIDKAVTDFQDLLDDLRLFSERLKVSRLRARIARKTSRTKPARKSSSHVTPSGSIAKKRVRS